MCKHQKGEFFEYCDAEHSRLVEDGKFVEDSCNNEYGNITGYLYKCWDCKKYWKYRAPNQKSLPKWLSKLHYSAFSSNKG